MKLSSSESLGGFISFVGKAWLHIINTVHHCCNPSRGEKVVTTAAHEFGSVDLSNQVCASRTVGLEALH